MEQKREQGPAFERTLDIFQPRAKRRLTVEDTREIRQNVVGFFGVLRDWIGAQNQSEPGQSSGK